LDKLILLNEIQTKLGMGLESKEGALRTLGEEFPEEKLEEIRQELIADATADGALQLVKIQIQKEIMDMTGMMPGPDGNSAIPITPQELGDGDVLGDGIQGPESPDNIDSPENQAASMMEDQSENSLREALLTQAYGTKIPQRRTVEKDN